MNKVTKIALNDGYLEFHFDNGHVYDPNLKTVLEKGWLHHMRQKIWFTNEVMRKTLKLLSGN